MADVDTDGVEKHRQSSSGCDDVTGISQTQILVEAETVVRCLSSIKDDHVHLLLNELNNCTSSEDRGRMLKKFVDRIDLGLEEAQVYIYFKIFILLCLHLIAQNIIYTIKCLLGIHSMSTHSRRK